MTFRRRLTYDQELELVREYLEEDWKINDLSVIFKVSHRTVFRVLSTHKVPKKGDRRKKRRKVESKPRPPLQPCGTEAAYRRHKRKKEYPCTECLAAHVASVKYYKEKK